MKQWVVLSGKGGVGKTVLAASLADLAARERSVVLADADVDASNLELLLDPTRREEHRFMAGQIGVIDPQECALCGVCLEVCRFDAVEPPAETDPLGGYRIDPTACEGCAACAYQCPTETIRMEPQQGGAWFRSDTRFGPLFHAQLLAGGENSGKLVTLVKQKARELAQHRGAALVLIDGPPGIGCPVIAAIGGADLALIVTEPTVSGEHDLERVLGLADHFSVPSAVVVNKADINPRRADAIERVCRSRDIAFLGRLPYDESVLASTVQGEPVTRSDRGPWAESVHSIWHELSTVRLEPAALPLVGRSG